MSGVLGVIVAAGRGTRLRPFTDRAPKCLHPFAGRRLIDWQLEALRANGIARIGMVRGYRKEMLAEFGLETWDNPRWEETNMVYSLLCAREALLAAETVVVAYADIVYEPRLIAALLAASDDVATTVDLDWLSLWRIRFADPLSDAESLKMDRAHAILDIGRKVKSLGEIEAQYMGLLKFTAKGMRAFVDYCDARGAGAEKLAMTDVLAGLTGQGTLVRGVPVRGGWLEFDGTSDVAAYAKLGPSGGLKLGRAAVSA
jgi:L-glutamine-phosphate cytidylyltransferase